eukprot:TRINITY_DN11065_c0_g1_i1.p1 TRINITY_DN11065_c0_g1~~TRINITY_DN11065_c0_g1_i1.p1  ORF type:complete len:719 (+),score=65.22 TRINITY_DN11065_c0_g1_i1:217-2157(+)
MTLEQIIKILNQVQRNGIKSERLVMLVSQRVAMCDKEELLPSVCVALVNAHARMQVPIQWGLDGFKRVVKAIQECHSNNQMYRWNPDLLSNVLIALSKLDVRDEVLLKNVGDFIPSLADYWSPSQIVRLLNAYARFGYQHEELFAWCCDTLLDSIKFQDIDDIDIPKAIWSFGKLGYLNETVVAFLKKRVIQAMDQNRFIVSGLAQTVTGLSNLNQLSQDFLTSLFDYVQHQIHNLEPNNILQLVQVLQMQVQQSQLINDFIQFYLMDDLKIIIHQFNGQQLLKLLQLINQLELQNNPSHTSLLKEIIEMYQSNQKYQFLALFSEILTWTNKAALYDQLFFDQGVQVLIKNNYHNYFQNNGLDYLINVAAQFSQQRYHNEQFMNLFVQQINQFKNNLSIWQVVSVADILSNLNFQNQSLFYQLQGISLIYQDQLSNKDILILMKSMAVMDIWDEFWWLQMIQYLKYKLVKKELISTLNIVKDLTYVQKLKQPIINDIYRKVKNISDEICLRENDLDNGQNVVDENSQQQKLILQQEVYSQLQQMGYNPVNDYPIGSKVQGIIDVAILDAQGQKVSIIIHEDFEYARNVPNLPLADFVIKQRLLQGCGWRVIRVRKKQWQNQKQEQLGQYLRKRILDEVGVLVLSQN